MSNVSACQIIGFGPACTSFLISADREGLLPGLLDKGLVVYESSPNEDALMKTGIHYDIFSNSDGHDFLEGISPNGLFASVLNDPIAQQIKALGNDAIPLQWAALLIQSLRRCFIEVLRHYPKSHLYYSRLVTGVQKLNKGWQCHSVGRDIKSYDAENFTYQSTWVIFACGSKPSTPPPLQSFADKKGISLHHSEAMLRPGGIAPVLNSLTVTEPNIVVLGGSHSAFSVLQKLITSDAHPNKKITLLHTRPIRRMHLNREHARLEQEEFNDPLDVCPNSGKVFRFQGLYKHARALFERIQSGLYPNVQLQQSQNATEEYSQLKMADVIIAATGYRPRLPKITYTAGSSALLSCLDHNSISVNQFGQIVGKENRAITGLLALGLGFGRSNSGLGESSYRGTPVGINIFQTLDGDALCAQLKHASHDLMSGDHFEQSIKEMGESV